MSPSATVVLAVNSGSSSLKAGLYELEEDGEHQLLRAEAADIGRSGSSLVITDGSGRILESEVRPLASQLDALRRFVELSRRHHVGDPDIVGHRIVHGGPDLTAHQIVTGDLLQTLRAASHFAPLHIPQAIGLLQATLEQFPSARQVACFDTAFHAQMPELARRLPLPESFAREGLRRYGFHGLSYESVVHRLGASLPERVVIAHLGSGASLCALRWGRSIDTTMSLTPASGILMGTRSGDLDPEVLLFLLRRGATAAFIEDLVNHHAGLAALSGGESDMRRLIERESHGDPAAALAVAAFIASVKKGIGAFAALLGGLDMLVFTGGIGANSRQVRGRICADLNFLGPEASGPRILSLETEEERQIARICRSFA